MRQKSLTNEECIRRFKNIHGNKYDYSRFNHISLKTKGEIICPFHGHFFQTTGGHLNGKGCRLCGYLTISKKLSSNKSSFIMKANIIHKNIYDYSKVNYINNRIKVEIICPIHGSFFQTPNNHLNGNKCLKCQPERISISLRKNNVEAINDFKIIHGNIYDYSKTKYGKNQKTKVEIICKKHGSFWQTPTGHLNGKGCSKCNFSKGEIKILQYLINNNIDYIHQKYFKDCKNPKTNKILKFDFYLPYKNLLIEYDGKQHFNLGFMGKHKINKKELKYIKYRDNIKTKYVQKNNIKLLRIKYTKLNKIDNILDNYFSNSK